MPHPPPHPNPLLRRSPSSSSDRLLPLYLILSIIVCLLALFIINRRKRRAKKDNLPLAYHHGHWHGDRGGGSGILRSANPTHPNLQSPNTLAGLRPQRFILPADEPSYMNSRWTSLSSITFLLQPSAPFQRSENRPRRSYRSSPATSISARHHSTSPHRRSRTRYESFQLALKLCFSFERSAQRPRPSSTDSLPSTRPSSPSPATKRCHCGRSVHQTSRLPAPTPKRSAPPSSTDFRHPDNPWPPPSISTPYFERSERRAGRPEQYQSLSSDGRPGLGSPEPVLRYDAQR